MRTFALVVLVPALLVSIARAGTNAWSALGGDLFWSTAGNWSPSGPPGPNDEARFFNPGAVADATVDIVVSASTNIQRLWFGQTNGPNQNMTLNPGVTLTVSGTNDNGYGPLGSDPDAGGITPDPVPMRYLSTIYVGTKTTNSSTQIWDMAFLKIDSDQAEETAQKHGGDKILEKSPDTPVTYVCDWNRNTNELVWHVIYGSGREGAKLVVSVNASTGEFIRVEK